MWDAYKFSFFVWFIKKMIDQCKKNVEEKIDHLN